MAISMAHDHSRRALDSMRHSTNKKVLRKLRSLEKMVNEFFAKVKAAPALTAMMNLIILACLRKRQPGLPKHGM